MAVGRTRTEDDRPPVRALSAAGNRVCLSMPLPLPGASSLLQKLLEVVKFCLPAKNLTGRPNRGAEMNPRVERVATHEAAIAENQKPHTAAFLAPSSSATRLCCRRGKKGGTFRHPSNIRRMPTQAAWRRNKALSAGTGIRTHQYLQ